MFRKILFAVAAFVTTMGLAFAQVDVNKADQAALDGIKGIGPKMSRSILEERRKGEFKDWADFESRVKGVGVKSAAKLSQNGLTVNGKSRPGTTAKGDRAKPAATEAKPIAGAKK